MDPKPPDEETPFLHHPDLLEDEPEKNGLYCFLDMSRPCGPDCMSYLSERPEGTDYQGNQWSQCLLLVSAHRGAKHLTILASVTDGLLKKTRMQTADQARATQNPPPSPR